jgi:hypothetical protein
MRAKMNNDSLTNGNRFDRGKNREWNDEKIYMIYAKKMF